MDPSHLIIFLRIQLKLWDDSISFRKKTEVYSFIVNMNSNRVDFNARFFLFHLCHSDFGSFECKQRHFGDKRIRSKHYLFIFGNDNLLLTMICR